MKNPKSEIRNPNRCACAGEGPGAAGCSASRMEPRWNACPIIAVAALLMFTLSGVRAQSYSIDWHTIDGGGGTSTGGVYSLSGTIGQSDAAPSAMTGGNYSLIGGFWAALTAIQTEGAPNLWVMFTSSNTVCVWWPVPPSSWQLQATASLASGGGGWTATTYATNGGNCVYTEPLPAGPKFYRLYKP
ncbi:MAG TPA: hypothetical protein VJA21_16155 [Verrucomicrobiae bacterium]